MENFGTFNGLPFYDTYRLVLMGGLDSLIQMPDMKEPESYDWGDENGTEVYLDKRYVKPRNISLQFLLMADSAADFWTRYRALLGMLIAPGKIRLYIDELQRSFYVYYTRQSNTKAVTLFNQDGKVCATLTLEFIEPQPSLFTPYTYLIDGSGNYITDNTGSRILIG